MPPYQLIQLLKEILYVLEGDYLSPFIQLDRNDGSLKNQVRSAIKMLDKIKED